MPAPLVAAVAPVAAGELSERELREYLFRPGFSTAASMTELAGRGVGLDVVRSGQVASVIGGILGLVGGAWLAWHMTHSRALALLAMVMREQHPLDALQKQQFAGPITSIFAAQRAAPLAPHRCPD